MGGKRLDLDVWREESGDQRVGTEGSAKSFIIRREERLARVAVDVNVEKDPLEVVGHPRRTLEIGGDPDTTQPAWL